MSWIEENQALVDLCISIATLLVWVIYAQLLFSGFRRQRSPRLIINRGKKKDMNALCIISNMSMEAIYVEYIIAVLRTSHGTVTMDVTDFERAYTEEQKDNDGNQQSIAVTPNGVHENTRQGPLLSGDFMHIGTFNALVWRLAKEAGIPMRGFCPENDIKLKCLTIQVIALYGPDSRPISASRGFDINSDEEVGTLTPASWQTHQGVSFLHRRRLCRLVDEMNETNFSSSSTIAPQENQ
ncbi:hypothetical protein [Marinimicrobium sp. C2-29]|uniref:hypothetical protein n=1 Tax=Marinimicrobium sp. C2-29 TaxID=3139825 RepID=UPI003139432E